MSQSTQSPEPVFAKAVGPIGVTVPEAVNYIGPQRVANRWRQLALLSGLISMDNSEGAVASTLFPAVRAAPGLPLSALGVMVAVHKIIQMIFGPVWVLVAARVGRKKVLVVCCGLWGVWSAAAGLSQNFVQLLALYGVAALGFAAGGPLINGILADLFDDNTRGRAAGLLYGGFALLAAVIGPLLGQLSRIPDGWRYGFFASGGLTVVFGLLVWRYFDDPRVGAADGAHPTTDSAGLSWSQIRELLGSNTLQLIIGQRLMASQLALTSFGVVFLVDDRDFSNAVAATILPFAMVSYVLGTVVGGIAVDRIQQRIPGIGRLAVWQASTLGWGLAAALCTQVAWSSIWIYAIWFSVLGLLQGFIPGCNRPVLMSVTRPDLRSGAFALMIGAESAGWAVITLLIGYLGDRIGLQAAFLYLVVLLTVVNGLFMSAMYRPFLRESAMVRATLASAP
ncbi:MFS transporter [Nocardia sp. SYP-A9097]|uniref:MFS transporter n=1 Tax=Nocardia sp. SYP-A9097 TaxID=2663237 RepID=UPI00129BC6B5|nr:MFS transporter [Nocardia sp. SYP-A9097]MRH91708.1 MFS transporter [Nocardia sp. SYP-A9097]